MVTMLEVINRIPAVCTDILNHREETFAVLTQTVKAHPEINQILLIGSGTSNTSAVTARGFIEKTSGLQTCLLYTSTSPICFRMSRSVPWSCAAAAAASAISRKR